MSKDDGAEVTPSPERQKRRLAPGGLQIVVSLVFILGGDALRTFGASGVTTILGYVHIGLGVVALPAALALVSARPWARRFALGLNVVMIAYGLATEGVVDSMGTLAPNYFLDSMVGTLVAVAINVTIILLLYRSKGP